MFKAEVLRKVGDGACSCARIRMVVLVKSERRTGHKNSDFLRALRSKPVNSTPNCISIEILQAKRVHLHCTIVALGPKTMIRTRPLGT